MATSLREVIATFGVKFDDKQLKRGNKSITESIGGLKAFGAALAGSAVVVGLRNMVTGLATEADALAKQSRALGLSMQELQEWQHAANLSGVEAAAFGKSIITMQRAASEAADGVATYADAFRAAGVDVKDTATGAIKPTSQLIEELGVGIMGIEDPARRTAVAMDLFGKQGSKLLNLFEAGPEGIKALRAELGELGGGFTDEFAKNAEEMNDNLARMDLASTSLKVSVVNFLVPALSRLAIGAARVIAKLKSWGETTAKVLGASNLFKSLIIWLGAGGVMHVLKLAGGFKGLGAILLRGLGILSRFLLKFVLPALILDDLITTFMGGDTVIKRALDSMFGAGTTQKVLSFFDKVYDSVVDFFKNFTTRLSEFKEFFSADLDEMGGIWAGFIGSAIDLFSFLGDAITGDWQAVSVKFQAILALMKTAVEIIAFEIGSALVGAASMAEDAFASAVNSIIENVQEALQFIGAASAAAGLDKFKLEGGNADAHGVESAQARGFLAERAEKNLNMISGTNQTTVQVTVPPGTDANLAQRVGNAAANGVARGQRANLAAFTRAAP